MSTWHDVGDVLEMYRTGGLVIMTGMDGAVMETAVSSSSSSYTGKIYDRTGIRTTVQLDSDYMTVLPTAVLHQPDLWEQHMIHVHRKLTVLDTVLAWAKQSWLFFLLIPLAWYGYDLVNIGSVEEAWRLIYPTVLSAAIVLGRKWLLRFLQVTILPLIMRVIGRVMTRRFNQFVEEM